MPTDPSLPPEAGRPGGWVEGVGWVAWNRDVAWNDSRNFGHDPWLQPVVVTRWADGTTPAPRSAAPVVGEADGRLRYYIDTEFIEDGTIIDLISIGVVCQDGRTFYAETDDVDLDDANDWVKANVVPHLTGERLTRESIAQALIEFVAAGDGEPEFWAYYADYDWVAVCQLFGTMMDLPDGWPMFCMDIKQEAQRLGVDALPEQTSTEHHALADARWNVEAHASLLAAAAPSAPTPEPAEWYCPEHPASCIGPDCCCADRHRRATHRPSAPTPEQRQKCEPLNEATTDHLLACLTADNDPGEWEGQRWQVAPWNPTDVLPVEWCPPDPLTDPATIETPFEIIQCGNAAMAVRVRDLLNDSPTYEPDGRSVLVDLGDGEHALVPREPLVGPAAPTPTGPGDERLIGVEAPEQIASDGTSIVGFVRMDGQTWGWETDADEAASFWEFVTRPAAPASPTDGEPS